MASSGKKPKPWPTKEMRISFVFLSLFLLGACGKKADATICQLRKVIDGDSLRLECRGLPVEVRLWCLDAPEYSQGQWGKKSAAYLHSLMPREVEIKIHDQDQFGRLVVEAFSLGPYPTNINLTMVQNGQAAVFDRFCSNAEYKKIERQARDYRIGIWSRDGLQQRPWEYRRKRGRRR